LNFWVIHFLRIVHIIAACFWVGVAILNVFFLSPSVRAAGPAGAPVMRELVQVRRLPVFVNGAAVLAVLSGTALYWWRSDGMQNSWTGTRSGIVFGVGGVFGVLALLLGVFLVGRNVTRMGQLAARAQTAGGPPPPELQAELSQVQARLRVASFAAVTLVILAATFMALGRYV
jgi:uncharacterized membrane protein